LHCFPDGSIKADYEGTPAAMEYFHVYQTMTNNIKLYSPMHNKYVRMDADGSVHCNEASADYATLWSTPAN
jgi:hypothetical protein